MTNFPGFEPKHFDAYEERKWASNRYNLERMRVREVMESLASIAFNELGDAQNRLCLTPTQDHPTIFNHKRVDAQWLLIRQPEAEVQRTRPLREREIALDNGSPESQPQLATANIGLRVDISGFEIAVRVHKNAALDRHNLLAKLKDEEQKTAFVDLLHALPETAVLIVDTEIHATSSTDDSIIDTLTNALTTGATWLGIGFAWGREHSDLSETTFAALASTCTQALLPVYDFIAWTETNDFVDGVSYLESEQKRRAERAASDTEDAEDNTSAVPKAAPAKSRPTTRGGWSYRPDWQFDPTPSEAPSGPKSPSSRVRERAAELQREARDWNYSGPRREQPNRARPARDDRRSNRDDNRGPRQDNEGTARGGNRRPSSGRPRNHDKGNNPRRGGNERGDRRTGGGNRGRKRDTQRGPTTTQGRKSVDKTQWVDAQGDVSAKDYVRIASGLFAGKIAQVVDHTKKGFRVVLGDGGMTVEVPKDGVTKIEEKS